MEAGKDLHKKNYVDKARLEFGTQVQFFEYTLDDVVQYNTILGGLAALIFFLTDSYATELFFAYIGAITMTIIFYFKFGTK